MILYQHFKAFETFLTCTIHFPIIDSSPPPNSISLSETIYTMCANSFPGCISIHTSVSTTPWSEICGPFDSKCFDKNFGKGHHLYSDIYKNAFRPIRYQHICRVYLPNVIVSNNGSVHFQIFDSEWFNFKYIFSSSFRHPLSPIHDFVIIPHTSISNVPTYVEMDFAYAVEVLLFDVKTKRVWFAQPPNPPNRTNFVNVTLFEISLPTLGENFDKLWWFHHLKHHKYQPNSNYNNDRMKLAWQATSCNVAVYAEGFFACIRDLIVDHYNISGLGKDGLLMLPNVVEANDNIFGKVGLPLASPHGFQFHHLGLSYFIVIRQRNLKLFDMSRLELLLSPFTTTIWILVILSMGCMSIVLRYTDFTKNIDVATFWLHGTLLEQGVSFRSKEYHNIYLVVIWLMSALLLRNFYAFSMYTDITSIPYPSQLPNSFNSLLNGSSIKLLVAWDCSRAFFMPSMHFYEVTERDRVRVKLMEKMVEVKPSIQLISALMTEKDVTVLRKEWDGTNMIVGKILFHEDFAFISVEPECQRSHWKTIFSTSNSLRVYENTEKLAFAKASYIGWYKHSYITLPYLRAISLLIQAGIYQYIKLRYNVMQQRQFLMDKLHQLKLSNSVNAFSAANEFTVFESQLKRATNTDYVKHYAMNNTFGMTTEKPPTIGELLVVWITLILSLGLATAVFLHEVIISTYNSFHMTGYGAKSLMLFKNLVFLLMAYVLRSLKSCVCTILYVKY